MNKIILSISFLIICVTSQLLSAQNVQLPTDYLRNSLSGKNDLPANVTGTVYINEEFQPGTVFLDDKTFETMIRYNGLKNEFEIKEPNGDITALLRRPGIKVSINNGPQYQIYPYLDENGIIKQIYFKELVGNGKVLFLKREGVEFNEAEKANTSYQSDKPASLEPFEDYYLKTGNEPAEKIRLRKKDVERFLKDDKTEDYIKEKDLNLKSEDEVIQVINYYNSL